MPTKLDSRAFRSAERHRGFTLLEVMAAVSILALIYVVLAQGAMQGILWEGDSRRRLEASLLADSILANLEAGWLSGGQTPEIGEASLEIDDYEVFISTTSADPGSMLGNLGNDQRSSRLRGSTDQVNPAVVLAELMPDGSPLLEVLVEVAWTDAQDERKIARRTYALDMATLGPLLEAAGVTRAAPPAGGGAPVPGAGQGDRAGQDEDS